MTPPLLSALLILGLGWALLIAGVYVLAGLGWALVLAGALPVLGASVMLRGLARVSRTEP